MDMVFVSGFLAAAVPAVGAIVGLYIKIRRVNVALEVEMKKVNREDRAMDTEMRRDDDNITIREWRKLYNEVKADLGDCIKERDDNYRWKVRCEAALNAHGIVLAPEGSVPPKPLSPGEGPK